MTSEPVIPESMQERIHRAVSAIRESKKPLAISHIDADGITALAIVVMMLEREGFNPIWKNIHQLNSDTIFLVKDLVEKQEPDLVMFSDLGTGQYHLIKEHIEPMDSVKSIIILDHHLPSDDRATDETANSSEKIIEINPCQHGMSGSYDLSGSGVSFLVAHTLNPDNVVLSELAIVGATGDLQDYYGKGFRGANKVIVELAEEAEIISIDRDLTFFGINTRPLPMLLEYATEPYLPGITGNRDACYEFFDVLMIPVKDANDEWRTWSDLSQDEKKRSIQKLIHHILETYESPKYAEGILGDVYTLIKRPAKSEMRSAKEFSTLLNACGRNRRAEVGVEICLRNPDAFQQGKVLLQQHRANLAGALRRLEEDGYKEREGFYLVDDPKTPDTIIGIVIGMAQGARIVPIDKPVIGVSTNTSDDGPMVKLSGRARRRLIKQGINLKETFVAVANDLNSENGELVAEAGGHPMAAGAFVHTDYLHDFLERTSSKLSSSLRGTEPEKI